VAELDTQRQLAVLADQLERLRKADVTAIYPPFTSERLLPFPLASSASALGYFGQPWAVQVLAFYATVFVVTTNNGTNFWTINLNDSTGTTVASFNTSAIAANTSTRFSDTTITQPAAASTSLTVIATATLSPGAIYIVPSVAWLRTGN
jgi:hypothetical protein